MLKMHDFHCCTCGHDFEELVRDGETPPCPSCQSRETRRLIGAPAAHFKGSGFHGTDYGKYGRKKAAN